MGCPFPKLRAFLMTVYGAGAALSEGLSVADRGILHLFGMQYSGLEQGKECYRTDLYVALAQTACRGEGCTIKAFQRRYGCFRR
jgi:hypothetical protein